MAKSERSYQSGATKWWKCKYYFKKFITFLFSHIGLTGCVVGYIIFGAIIFRELEIGYERQIKGKVLQNRAKFADMIYTHCRSFSQAQMFAHAMTPCPTAATTPSSFSDVFMSTTTTSSSSSSTLSPYFEEISTTPLYNNYSNVLGWMTPTDMRNSNNYGDGDDRLLFNATTVQPWTLPPITTLSTTTARTTSTSTTTTTARTTTSTTAQTTSSAAWPFNASPSTPAVAFDRRELQARVSDAIVDLWQSAEMRQLENVVAHNTWEINERFNVLYKRNWTREARRELRQLERRLLQRVYTQIMMSIFGAGDLRANELSLDLDDSMVTDAPPEASSAIMDEVRRPSNYRTTPSSRRRQQQERPRPPRNFDAPMLKNGDVESSSPRNQLLNDEVNQNHPHSLHSDDPQPVSSRDNVPSKPMLPFLERFKRQAPQSSGRASSPTVGPPDSAGRRRLSPFSTVDDTASSTNFRPFNNSTAVSSSSSNNNTFPSVVVSDDESDVIASIDADDDDDVLLFGEEKVDEDEDARPPAREPPDYSQNNTDDYFTHRRRIGIKASDFDEDSAVTPAARNETVERLLDILHNQDWLLSDQQAQYFNRSVFDLVIYFEQNVSNFILKEGYDGSMDRELWSFSGGLLFSLTVITTIGYGHIAPKTISGRLCCVAYSLLGIPLMLLCLANIGDAMAIAFKFIYWKICCLYCHYKKRQRRLKRARSIRSMRKSPLPSALRKQSGKSQETSGSGSTVGRGGGGGPGGETSSRSGVGGESNPIVAITGPSSSSPVFEDLNENNLMMNYRTKPSMGSGIVTGDRLLAQPLSSTNMTTTTTSTSSSASGARASSSTSPSSSMMKEIIITKTELPDKKGSAAALIPNKSSSIDDGSSANKLPLRMPPGIRSAAALLATTPEHQSTSSRPHDIEQGATEDSEMNLLSAPSGGGGGTATSGESETEFSTAIVAVSDEHSLDKQGKAANFVVPSTSDEWASSERGGPSSPDFMPEERRRLLTTKETTGPLGERRISVTLSAPHNNPKAMEKAGGGGGNIKKAKKVITIDRAVSEPGELATSVHEIQQHHPDTSGSPAVTTSQGNFESWGGSLEGDNFTERYKRVNVPVWACLLVVVLYLFGGGIMFSQWEGWNVFEGAYFCYISLTTIGFGDIVPGFSAVESDRDAQIKMALCALYLLFGMALLAMSFNLVQENVIDTCKNLARRLGILVEDEDENL